MEDDWVSFPVVEVLENDLAVATVVVVVVVVVVVHYMAASPMVVMVVFVDHDVPSIAIVVLSIEYQNLSLECSNLNEGMMNVDS